jgi:hypothetical protein
MIRGSKAPATERSQEAERLRAFFIFQVAFWGANFTIRTLAAIAHRPEYAFTYMPDRALIIGLSFAAITGIHFVLVRTNHWPQLARLGLALASSLHFPGEARASRSFCPMRLRLKLRARPRHKQEDAIIARAGPLVALPLRAGAGIARMQRRRRWRI